MKLLYCYILFLDDKGKEKEYRGLHHVELNLSAADRFVYDRKANILRREERKAPLPAHFWSAPDTAPDYRNIYNVNVIAGENGSGKTTAMRCVMNLLDFLHGAADQAVDKSQWKGFGHRALLLLEENGRKYLLDYAPAGWTGKKPMRTEGFSEQEAHIFSCRNWKEFAEPKNAAGKAIAALLLKTKVIYLTNTLTQYDYERHLGEKNERLRDFFIYDASVGSTIGPEIAQFFSYEIYKQVKYVFDKRQAAIRRALKDRVPELKTPNALRLRLRIEQYQEAFYSFIRPIVREELASGKSRVPIPPECLDLPTLLGVLCAAAYADNLGRFTNTDFLSAVRKRNREIEDLSSCAREIRKTIRVIESAYYQAMGSLSLKGHEEAISCVTVLPDGRVISGSYDNTLRVWDAASGRCLRTLEGHTGGVICMAVLPDGRVVSGSRDSTLLVWDTATGECLKTLKGHTGAVYCVSVLPDGRVVSGSFDTTLRVWDSAAGKCLQTLKEHMRTVNCVAALPDGRVVSGSDENVLRIWDANTGECLQTLAGHMDGITCVAAFRDGRVVSGSKDKTLRVWDAETGSCQQVLSGHTGDVYSVAVLPDQRRVISASRDGTVGVWDAVSGDCLQILGKQQHNITCVAVLTENQAVTGSNDGAFRVWDTETGQCVQTLTGEGRMITCAALLPDGRVTGGSMDHSLLIWTPEEQLRQSAPFAHRLGDWCRDYLDFLFGEKQKPLFSLFTRISENTFELSRDAMEQWEKQETGHRETEEEKIDLFRDLRNFIQKYRYTCEPAYTIDFDWGLSSGEENMLRIFSSLYHIFDRDYSSGRYGDYKIYNNEAHAHRDKGKTACDTVLLFMDEADLTLHPEWQRRLIAILTAFIPQIYPASCARDIQLILSTHSPLLLGDIPSENITYLFSRNAQDDQAEASCRAPGETFGQNIHSILKESFFLGKGTVGDFAAGKINGAAKRLGEIKAWAGGSTEYAAPYEGEMNGIRQIIALVAPGVLRTKLEILFREAEDEWTKKTGTAGGGKAQTASAMNREQLLLALRGLSPEERKSLLKDLERGGAAND